MKAAKIKLEELQRKGYLALLENNHSFSLQAKGWSMSPLLKSGDSLTIKYIEPKKMKIGNIIAYKREGEDNIVVHRLVKMSSRNGRLYFCTKGDAVYDLYLETPIYEEDILGRVIMRRRNNKIINFDTRLAHITGYIYANLLLYCPQAIVFLRKIIRVFRKIMEGSISPSLIIF